MNWIPQEYCDKATDDAVSHGYEGVNLLNASGECAGQSVPHLHIPIIPRKKQDGIDAWPEFRGATQSLEAIHEKLKMLD